MKRLLLLLPLLGGCVSLANKPIDNLHILGNPYLRCENKAAGVQVEGTFVCLREWDFNAIIPCQATQGTLGWITLDDGTGIYNSVDPKKFTCYLADPRDNQ